MYVNNFIFLIDFFKIKNKILFSCCILDWVGKQISLIRSQAAILTDKRLALITEIINAIQQIKMFVWEEAFIDKINLIRKYV